MISPSIGLLFWSTLIFFLPAAMIAAFLIHRASQKKQRLKRAKQKEVIDIIRLATQHEGKISALVVANTLVLELQKAEELLDLLTVDGIFQKELTAEGKVFYRLTSIHALPDDLS